MQHRSEIKLRLPAFGLNHDLNHFDLKWGCQTYLLTFYSGSSPHSTDWLIQDLARRGTATWTLDYHFLASSCGTAEALVLLLLHEGLAAKLGRATALEPQQHHGKKPSTITCLCSYSQAPR